MIMADVLKIFLLVVGALVIYVSYWLVSEALFPDLVKRASQNYRDKPFKITFLGLLIGGPLAAFGAALGDAAGGDAFIGILGLAVISVPVFLGLAGSAGLCRLVGEGLPSPEDEHQPWRRVLRGGLLVSFTFLLPFLGWFVVMPWTIGSGFGAALLALKDVRKERRKSQEGPQTHQMEVSAA